MTTKKKPWSFKLLRRPHNGRQTVFRFQGRDFMLRTWYPPWQNEKEYENAKQIVDDLNAAFAQRNKASQKAKGAA